MDPKTLIQEYEGSRGFLRDLPDHDLLTLVGRLATELVVRRGDGDQVVAGLHESIDAGRGVGRAILAAQGAALAGADPTRKN